MGIVVGTNSWVTEAEANEYFSTRLGADDYWTDGADDNIPALITAYKWLNNCGKFSFPSTATDKMKELQCEMALFLLQHQPDIDLRMGLQAQGVVKAGVVKEDYREVNGIPLPPVVADLAKDYLDEKPAYIVELERDEEERVDYDAYEHLTD